MKVPRPLFIHHICSHAKGSLSINLPSSSIFPQLGDFTPSLSRLLVVSCFWIGVFCPIQPILAETVQHPIEENLSLAGNFQYPIERNLNLAENLLYALDKVPILEEVNQPILAESQHPIAISTHVPSPNKLSLSSNQDLYQISTLSAEKFNAFQDFARVFSPTRANSLINDIQTLETETGWRLRVLTKSGSLPSISGKDLKDLWKPDEKTVIVIEDLSSPNILNFNTGSAVMAKLPRQFFTELQSRYGNQFYVQQEGEGAALMSTVQAIDECLRRPEGCKSVPGLTNDLYYLTLGTSFAGGCVFGFAARLPPSGRVEASWQWVVFLSPLWLLLFVPFGILPVIGRTSELAPLLKNTVGFAVGAAALYLTPIFGPSPISKQ